MQIIERDGYTRQEILDMLFAKYTSRVVKFRYDLLDKEGRKIGELGRVENGEVTMTAFGTIKRTAKFTLQEETVSKKRYMTWNDLSGQTWNSLMSKHDYWSDLYTVEQEAVDKIDWLSHMIQPFMLFQMPDGGWVEFSLGVFIPSTPTRKDVNGQVVRDVEAYDKMIILQQDVLRDRWYIPAGTTYEQACKELIESAGITEYKFQFEETKTLKFDKEFDAGTSKLDAINDLLQAVNNTIIWVDASGYFVSEEYAPPSQKGAEFTYETDDVSVIAEEIEEELDTFGVANAWVAVVSNPEGEPMSSYLENNNPDSPTSIPARGRVITDRREVEDMASQAELDKHVERIAHEASQIYGKIKFRTASMPFHERYDILRFKYDPLGIDDSFAETKWTIKLQAGALMEHEARRVVDLNER